MFKRLLVSRMYSLLSKARYESYKIINNYILALGVGGWPLPSNQHVE